MDEMRARVIEALECAIEQVKSGKDIPAMWFGALEGWVDAPSYKDAASDMEKAMDEARDGAHEGWPDHAADMCWGVFVPVTVHTEEEMEAPEDSGFDFYVDFQPEEWVEVCAWRNK